MAKHIVTAKLLVTADDWAKAIDVPYMINKIPGLDKWIRVTSTHWEEEVKDENTFSYPET